MVAGGDADRAGRLVAKLAQPVDLGADLVEMRPDRLKQALARLVAETLRVVRVSRRTPSRSSSLRMVWLSAEGETPSCAAARVKLRSRATWRKATRSLMVSRALLNLLNGTCAF